MKIIGGFALVALCASADAHPLYLSGTVGPSPALAVVERDGGHLSGWYLYLRHGKEIRLDGRIDAKGNFRLDEFAADRKTGSFKGAASGTRWTGEWRNAAGSAPQAFVLDEDRDALSAVNGRVRCTTKKNDKQFGYIYTHSVDMTLSKGTLKSFTTSRGETSAQGDDQSCSIELGDLKRVPSDAGILLRSKGDDPGAENAPHCTVRILAAGDYLYVQMGDSSETGNDCRGAADAMYCSPRSFWADMIVERKTQLCKSVK